MISASTKFKKDSAAIAFDEKHRQTIKFNISRYDNAVAKGFTRYNNLSRAKAEAARIKRDVLRHWDEYLLQFEKNITAHGARVLWAENVEEALGHIKKLLLEHEAKLLVKSKSMTTEEIGLNEMAGSIGCESVETDLGEFIVQVAGERPYHIVTPAMHKSKGDIARLFNEKFGTPPDSTPTEMANYVRGVLRKKYTTADVGVTGANFLIADAGAISVTENEGNGVMSTSFPKLHIVVAGIEKLIPKMDQLGLFYPLLAVHGTGQQITAYNTIISGPKKGDECDGPEEMVVVLIDNGRTNLYADPVAWEALSCIRCGACLNGCPVYKTVGGYTYDTTYSGPIGSAITPHLRDFGQYVHLSFACSLCGKCAEGCPVRIPLTEIMLANRQKAVRGHLRPAAEKAAMRGFKTIASRRIGFDLFPAWCKNLAVSPFNHVGWGPRRAMPKFAKTDFSQMVRNRKKRK